MHERLHKMQEIELALLNLQHSPLYPYRMENEYLPVIGQGSLDAQVMLIGEAPGKNEAQTGKPFCGASGRVLDELLASIGLDREQVYITNIVKDRPPDNRDPRPGEIALYAPFLEQQIVIIQPRIIATLGRFSMAFVLGLAGAAEQHRPIGELHGQVIPVHFSYGAVQIVPLYHPAVALYSRRRKPDLLADFQVLRRMLD